MKLNADELIELRKAAEAAVDGMPDDLKVIAFTEILKSVLTVWIGERQSGVERAKIPTDAKTGRARLINIRANGFFSKAQSLSEIQQELKRNGWNYPMTTLSGIVQQACAYGELRRAHAMRGIRKVWVYSKP
jgi:hypothetical protein